MLHPEDKQALIETINKWMDEHQDHYLVLDNTSGDVRIYRIEDNEELIYFGADGTGIEPVAEYCNREES